MVDNAAFPGLSSQEQKRYRRQIVIPGMGDEGQQKLKKSRVMIVGLGGLGSPVALYLAAAGVGHLSLVEGDCIEESNLQRQILYTTGDIGKLKAECAARHLQSLNPCIEIDSYPQRLTESNASSLIVGHDLVLSCVDNRATRQLLNSVCYSLNIPWIDAGVVRAIGTVMTFLPHRGPCYACLHNEPTEDESDLPLSPASLGVWGAAAGAIGSLQAMEAINFLLEREEHPVGRMLWVDMQEMICEAIFIQPSDDCPVCGQKGRDFHN